MTTKVITYQDTRAGQISLTPRQVEALEAAGQWPRNQVGEEYATVSHGLHRGTATWTDDELARQIAGGLTP